jgi:hypothetical protein
MFIYLASRYSRIEEMQGYKELLESDGHIVTSRWVMGDHQWDGSNDDDTSPGADLARKYALEDLEDIDDSETVMCFTEQPRIGTTRGGRHVEFGYALASRKQVVVVGPVENIFYSLPMLSVFNTFEWARLWAKETDKAWVEMRGLMSGTGLPQQSTKRGVTLRSSSSPDSGSGMTQQP